MDRDSKKRRKKEIKKARNEERKFKIERYYVSNAFQADVEVEICNIPWLRKMVE